MSKMAGPNSLWTKPQLAQVMRDNHAEADAQDAHALEDILAARQRARAAARQNRVRRLLTRMAMRLIRA